MRRVRSHATCPQCHGEGIISAYIWPTDGDPGGVESERPCDMCQERGWIHRWKLRRLVRRRREMSRSIARWIVRMGRARGLDGMPHLIQPHTPANYEVGGGVCWHPKTKTWPTFGRVVHRSMFAAWVKCEKCDGSGKQHEGIFGPFNAPCTECTGRGHAPGLSLIMRARHGGAR